MKLDRKLNVNTKQYWNQRYLTVQHNEPAIASTENFFKFGFIPKDKEVSVLEIGCGTATHYPIIHERYPLVKITGADISSFATEFNKKKYPYYDFKTIDIEKELLTEKYDYIISAHTFEHLTDPLAATTKCINASKEQTIICVPYKDSWSYDHEHMHTFSESEPYTDHDFYFLEFDVKNKVGAIYFKFKGKA
jgi:trans-aconitate methyltransferase